MSLRISPSEFVVPVFGFRKTENKWMFLGTGFFFGNSPFLATSNHVLGDMYDSIGIQVIDKKEFYRASFVVRKPEVDLAILKITKYEPPVSCRLGTDEEISFTQAIYSYEYGTTQNLGDVTVLSPATRMGNVTRTRNLPEDYGEGGDTMLELSFPALRGASGAPVVNIGKEVVVWGIIVANWSNHLLPTQVEKVMEGDTTIEEIKYLLPQAIAVNVKHLSKFIDEIDHNKQMKATGL